MEPCRTDTDSPCLQMSEMLAQSYVLESQTILQVGREEAYLPMLRICIKYLEDYVSGRKTKAAEIGDSPLHFLGQIFIFSGGEAGCQLGIRRIFSRPGGHNVTYVPSVTSQ